MIYLLEGELPLVTDSGPQLIKPERLWDFPRIQERATI
jgi:hypothetical protein